MLLLAPFLLFLECSCHCLDIFLLVRLVFLNRDVRLFYDPFEHLLLFLILCGQFLLYLFCEALLLDDRQFNLDVELKVSRFLQLLLPLFVILFLFLLKPLHILERLPFFGLVFELLRHMRRLLLTNAHQLLHVFVKIRLGCDLLANKVFQLFIMVDGVDGRVTSHRLEAGMSLVEGRLTVIVQICVDARLFIFSVNALFLHRR